MARFCLATMVWLSLSLPLLAAEKWALLIGVNDYTKGPPDWDLRGCENDVATTRELLISKFGFPAEHVKILLSGEATAHNILQAIQDWLVARTLPEDMVYFHFSGHGSQTADQDGDEEDGMDELICPTDLQQGVLSSVITDDQLREALSRIPARHVTIVLDACHSGTGTRDLSLSRPRFVEFEPGMNKAARGIVRVPAAQGKDKLAGSGGMEGSEKKQVTISGCRPDQTSADAWIREGFYAGALTYYLIENMKKAPPEMTYHQLLEQVARDLQAASYTQVPQLDGDMDQSLLGTQVEGAIGTPFVVVESVEGKQIRLNVGQAQGVAPGSIYAVFPPGEKLFKGDGIGRIKVSRVDQASSEALVLGEATVQPGCRAREVLRGFKTEPLRLRLEAPEGNVKEAVQDALSGLDFVEVVEEGQHFDHRLQLSTSREGIQAVLTLDGIGGPLAQEADAVGLVEALRPQLENAYAIKSLAGLDNPAPPFAVEVWANRAGNQETLDQAPDEKLVQARVGDLLRFNLRADKDCYLTLINLGTSGKITVLFPNQYRPDGFIQGGKVYQTGTKGELPFQIRATGPAGRELVKAIATLEPLDLSSLRMGEAGGAGTRTIESGSDFVRQLARDLAVEPLEAEGETVFLPTDKWSTDYLMVETISGGGPR